MHSYRKRKLSRCIDLRSDDGLSVGLNAIPSIAVVVCFGLVENTGQVFFQGFLQACFNNHAGYLPEFYHVCG